MSGTPTSRRKRASAAPRAPYHHGDLRRAMIEAAVQLVEEVGAENVTIREAARRAGVSSGAPFRHFETKTALMRAVAEDGMCKLCDAIKSKLGACRSSHPLVRLMAIADAYLHWAVQHPTHYRVLGDRTLIGFWESEILVRDNGWIRSEMKALFQQAHERGVLRPCNLHLIHLQSRALAYGLARMYVDGHLREFDIAKAKARNAMRDVMRAYVVSLAHDPEALRRALEAS